MSLYILDTDHVSLLQRGNPQLAARISALDYDEIAVTTITAEEQLRGRLRVIRRASSEERLVHAYSGLRTTLEFFKRIQLIDFDVTAAGYYSALRRSKIRIGTQDLRIAAAVLSVGGVLLTSNRRDFAQVPGLSLEDWSQGEAG